MKKVFIAGAIPETGLNQLKKHFDVDMYTGETLISQELLIQKIQDADALITLLSTQVSRQVIESAPKLKIIANYGAGFNNIDIQAAREHHINVTNTPIASTNATAELTMGILLAVARRIPEGDQLCRNEGFNLKITDDNLQVDYPRQFLKGAHAPSVKAQHVIHWGDTFWVSSLWLAWFY
ncbi:hypothetical protein HMPREF3134_07940 [Staphylococcus sp. HMSC14D10]|nr:hypothetical protein HMPREF3134_07940 [Staphylococcus sp. HMSC14D10]